MATDGNHLRKNSDASASNYAITAMFASSEAKTADLDKRMIGVTPSMRFFHLGTSRVRFDASRSRLDVTSRESQNAAQTTSHRLSGYHVVLTKILF